MKYMGIDVGTKRVGVACSDDAGTLAFPYAVLAAGNSLPADIGALVHSEGVDVVVIGDSRDRDNVYNAVHVHAQNLGAQLKAQGITVVYEWEGYSSAHARTLHSFIEGAPRGEVSRKRGDKRTRTQVDASAAALILQSYIDSR